MAVVPWNESASVTRLHFPGICRRFESGHRKARKKQKANKRKLKNMKSRNQYIARLIASVVFAFSLTANVYADDLPGFPDPGTNQPPDETNTVDWAAVEAAQQAQFTQDYLPWLQPDESSLYVEQGYVSEAVTPSGQSYFSPAEKEAVRVSNLQLIAVANQTQLDTEQSEIQSYLATNDIPLTLDSTNGSSATLRRIEDGSPVYFVLHDLAQAQTMAVPTLWTNGATGLNINGEGTLIGQFDGGNVLTNHQEFVLRVSNWNPLLPLVGHSTHVSGVLTSAGINTNSIGMSPRANVIAYPYSGDTTNMPTLASTNHVLLSNHSYGRVGGWYGQVSGSVYNTNGQYIGIAINWPVWNGNPYVSKTTDYTFGLYNSDATNADGIIYNANSYLPVYSAGNASGIYGLPNGATNGAANGFYCPSYNGLYFHWVLTGDPGFPTPPPGNGGSNGYTTITSYACAKNNLVVGSITNIPGGYQGSNSVRLSAFSSVGPTTDGRIKPDVVAPGENIYVPNTNSVTGYTNDSGTSFSSPAVAGALNLIVEENNHQNGTNAQLLASTLRGLVIHTADAAGTNAGPNYQFGWGLFDAQNAAQLFAANAFSNGLPFIKEIRLFNGDYIQFPVTITNGTPQLKVTICWTDPAGTAFPATVNPTNLALINDLDLRVISPSGSTNFPWVLNPANPSAAATRGDNFRDNNEQVMVPSPNAGTYLVQVTHKRNIVNAAGQSSAQLVSVLTSGIQPQPIPPVQILSSFAYSTNHLFALKWSSIPGLNYQVLQSGNLASGSWQTASDLISATKTNTSFVLPASTTGSQFFRIVATRP